ncbi:metallophosphoesterase family protein [Roseobacteraceae bacterium S113]
MTTIYAIGDVHGQFDMLADALELIEEDGGPDARVVVLGDLCDRGPDSFGVIELLRLGVAEGRDWTVLRGNHDQMFLDFLTRGRVSHPRITSKKTWLDPVMGGRMTLASYGIDPELDEDALRHAALKKVPQAHADFLSDLPLVFESGDLLFVHAGLRPDVPLEEQDTEDLMWIREPFLSHDGAHPWTIVHGHTALQAPQLYDNRVNLDGGAGHGRPLAVGVFEGGEAFLLTPMGRALF